MVGKHHTSWYPEHVPGSKIPLERIRKWWRQAELWIMIVGGNGVWFEPQGSVRRAHTPVMSKKRNCFLRLQQDSCYYRIWTCFRALSWGQKQLCRVFPLHKRASRMPGPQSLAALSVAMRAKSSWSKTVFWCSLILLIHRFTSRWPREEMCWESSAKSGSTHLIHLFQCCIYWLHIKGFWRVTHSTHVENGVCVCVCVGWRLIRCIKSSSFLPGLADFSEVKPASEFSEGMLWMDDRGRSVSVLVSQVDSVSLVQLSKYRGSRASVLLPPQPIALHRSAFSSRRNKWSGFHFHKRIIKPMCRFKLISHPQ